MKREWQTRCRFNHSAFAIFNKENLLRFRPLVHRLLLISALLFVAAHPTYAQANLGPQKGPAVTSSSSQINLKANAQKAIQIDILSSASGAALTGSTGPSSTGLFSLDFGQVDGLGLSSGAAGVTVTLSPTGALYSTPILLVPRFSGFATTTGSVSVSLDFTAGNLRGQLATREGASPAAMASILTPATITTAATTGTPITRYVGLFISNANGPFAVTGPLSSRLIYQVTVP